MAWQIAWEFVKNCERMRGNELDIVTMGREFANTGAVE